MERKISHCVIWERGGERGRERREGERGREGESKGALLDVEILLYYNISEAKSQGHIYMPT